MRDASNGQKPPFEDPLLMKSSTSMTVLFISGVSLKKMIESPVIPGWGSLHYELKGICEGFLKSAGDQNVEFIAVGFEPELITTR